MEHITSGRQDTEFSGSSVHAGYLGLCVNVAGIARIPNNRQ